MNLKYNNVKILNIKFTFLIIIACLINTIAFIVFIR